MDGEAPAAGAAVTTLVSELHQFEHLLRATFSAGGRVATALAAAQVDSNLSLVAGHQVFGAVSGANQGVAEAITRAAEAHRLLETLGKRLGYDVTSYGVEQKEPPPGFTEASDTNIRVAA